MSLSSSPIHGSTRREQDIPVAGTGRMIARQAVGWIIPLLYLLGFLPPWDFRFPPHPKAVLWLTASTWLERAGKMHLAGATLAITAIAVICCFLGAILRILGGRYARLLGSVVFATGVSVLMSPSGALLFLAGIYLLHIFWIAKLSQTPASGGDDKEPPFGEARGRWVPWIEVILREAFYLGFAFCFAILAWRYDSGILIRCLVICFGASLVIRALLPSATPVAKDESAAVPGDA